MNFIPDGKDWVEVFQALSVPAIAFAGVCIAATNLWLGFRKRRDDLFDRRYDFFRRAVRAWEAAAKSQHETGENVPDWEYRAALANEALFLFGPRLAEHLNNYTKPFDHHVPQLPNEDFVKPFDPYMRLGKSGSPQYD